AGTGARAGLASPLRAELARRIDHEVRALLDHEVELRCALHALLRDDLNHACRRLGAIQRRSGRSLDDFDALDVLRVEVVEGGGLSATANVRPVLGAVV